MLFNDLRAFLSIEIQSELFVDDPGREGRVKVHVNATLPYLSCEYIGIDIQDENGRHEVGFVTDVVKVPSDENGCRFEANFEINKARIICYVPGNFHLSTHSAASQPENYDMRHIVHSVKFGDDLHERAQIGSFNPLQNRVATEGEALHTHEYILKVVPSVYEDISGRTKYSYQYTYAHKEYIGYHHSGRIIPAIWFKYELQPITVKYTERRQPLYAFLTSVCAVVGGTFTVAGIFDSSLFSLSELYKKHQLGKLS
ncbi:Endoplasmic reticulum-Golgi intermediate compartment protein 1 [Toxocara canis]|uniref:Endoplasmic reticulum-Golgi intermediate compartment protein 1 n=1 Tax=Toxocara canis TaxID=6265 RepID=A0A0B2VLP8_TOXCA|nr:Endoplasmic reticulum-Golgi intermediate compartment protein 1 [Toxocara canis]